MTSIPKNVASKLVDPVPDQDQTQFKVDKVLNQKSKLKKKDIFEQTEDLTLTQEKVEKNRSKTVSKHPKKSKSKK